VASVARSPIDKAEPAMNFYYVNTRDRVWVTREELLFVKGREVYQVRYMQHLMVTPSRPWRGYWELTAMYEGRMVTLFRTRDRVEFRKMVRAMRRAVEDANPFGSAA
jgi:hypothetical protein